MKEKKNGFIKNGSAHLENVREKKKKKKIFFFFLNKNFFTGKFWS
jgi:hypothetical protein